VTDEELDAYEAAMRAERAVADGTGDEDAVDRWMGAADEASNR
jgi:hypothetical protein